MSKTKDLPYRRNVGIILINKDGQVFVGARIDNPDDAWQLPQGGVDKGEDYLEAAYRELEEETGVKREHTKLLAEAEEWLRYDLPDDLQKRIWGGKYRGQEQKWYVLRFTGKDSDININAHTPAEFRAWRWAPLKDLPDLAVPFKRDVYEQLVDMFGHLAEDEDKPDSPKKKGSGVQRRPGRV